MAYQYRAVRYTKLRGQIYDPGSIIRLEDPIDPVPVTLELIKDKKPKAKKKAKKESAEKKSANKADD
jgi:hypothetical protein